MSELIERWWLIPFGYLSTLINICVLKIYVRPIFAGPGRTANVICFLVSAIMLDASFAALRVCRQQPRMFTVGVVAYRPARAFVPARLGSESAMAAWRPTFCGTECREGSLRLGEKICGLDFILSAPNLAHSENRTSWVRGV
jgi:hypothetical protein